MKRSCSAALLLNAVLVLWVPVGCGDPGSVDCASSTPEYDESLDPDNIYLDLLVESGWNPGSVGDSRVGWSDDNGIIVGEDAVPLVNDGALGPPAGGGTYEGIGTYTCVGIGGSAVWRFRDEYSIFNGSGADFVTFASNFTWGQAVDGLVCELAHVEVSEDCVTWYYNANAKYLVNPAPEEDNSGYKYRSVSGLHGNNPTWANYTTNMQAQEIVEKDGTEYWADIPGECISIYFEPGDPRLGGVCFDLDDFRSRDDDTPWPDNGKMRYLKIVDDAEIVDGQDYDKDWCLGANLMSAMGINVRKDE